MVRIVTAHLIECDACGGVLPAGSERSWGEAEREARQRGWSGDRGGRHHCPACSGLEKRLAARAVYLEPLGRTK